MRSRLVLLLLSCSILWGASGCGREPLDKALVGAWVEDQVERRVEFTPNRLYAVVTNGERVDMGVWSVNKDNEVVFDSLLEKKQTVWPCRLDENELVIVGEKTFDRRFERVPRDSRSKLFDNRLEGLWRSDDRDPELVEFTASGILVGLFQRLDEKKNLNRLGTWAQVTRESSSAFFLEGTMGSATVLKSIPHKFVIEGDKLLWGAGRKRRPKVYRKVTPADVQLMLSKVPQSQPTTTPSAPQRPSK